MPSGAAGTTYYELTFTDTGSSPCRLTGFPKVSFADPAGHLIGAAATDLTGSPPSVVTLYPHVPVDATLAVGDSANFGPSCKPVATTQLRVVLPGVGGVFYVPHSDQACSATSFVTLSVGPIAAR